MNTAIAIFLSFLGTLQPRPVAIFVGPQTRDGFVDVDHGVIDSIRDVTIELKKKSGVHVVSKPDEATIVLVIVGRNVGANNGGIGIPAGAATLYVPTNRTSITSVLRVGNYEKSIVTEDVNGAAWRYLAKKVADDVDAWLSANRDRLPQ